MAKRTTVLLEDDLTGGPADETVRFALDGKGFEIDLSAGNANRLRQSLATYISAGRKIGRGSPVASQHEWARSEDADDSAVIRVWARENGYEVSERGRIPVIVRAAYHSAS
jgi:hypothetical protein